MVIIVLGMIPPEFFGPDNDYNIFDVFSTVMCIFEGSTVCAIMSALPLFSPILDALSTFAFVRKIFNKFGMSGAMGKRSKAAITLRRSYFDEIDFLSYNSWLIVCQNRLINVLKGELYQKIFEGRNGQNRPFNTHHWSR